MLSNVTAVGKRGREISPSCFFHSQLILCGLLLHLSTPFSHRIWLAARRLQQWCFLDRTMRSCQNVPSPIAPFSCHLFAAFSSIESSLLKCFSLPLRSDGFCLLISFVSGCVSTEWSRSVKSVNRHARGPYLGPHLPPLHHLHPTSAGMLTFQPTSQCGILI